MRWSVAIIRVVVVVAALFFLGGLALGPEAAFHFNGKCGGLIPFLSAPQPCTLSEYLWSSVSFSMQILLYEFWGWLLLIVIVMLASSMAIEWRRSRRHVT